MANRTLEGLKAYFYEHAYPTWQQFHDVLDSFRHKNDKLPITDVDGLADQLNGKASAEEVNSGRIASSTIDGNGHLILTLQDGSQLDAGLARGLDGNDGDDGIDGKGILYFEKTTTVGLVDTYTITYTDESTTEFYVVNGANGTILTADQLQIINTVPLVCSDEKTDLTASTDVPVIRFVFQTQQSFTKIVGELNTAPAGGTLTIVAKKNGASFLSTNLTFDSGESTTRTASVPFVFTTPTVSFSVGDYVEIFITIIGAVTPGKGLKIYLM